MGFEFKKMQIEDVVLILPKIFEDERGFFLETYKYGSFREFGIDVNFMQDNHSKSAKGVLRGLHYQCRPNSQAKLIRCISGAIYDVALDIRKNSKTFGQWTGAILSEENKNMLYIPEGFAHGFVALEDESEVVYKTNSEYHKESDRGILWNDPDLKIDWPIKTEPILSPKDTSQPRLKDIKEEELL